MAGAIETFSMVGSDLALDLVNTGSRRSYGPFRERLNSYEDLLTWAQLTEVVGEKRAKRLQEEAERRPEDGARVLERARELRETIYRVFSSVTLDRSPDPADLAALTEAAAEAARHRELRAADDGFYFEWAECDRLEQVLWPAALAAADLLVSDDRLRVKECATDNCNWLFLDLSKNRSRRWCDMRDCGNRAKARRHYARSKRSRE